MTKTRRPRVVAIGLDGPMVASIAPLCGELRLAGSLEAYLHSYSWTETDVVVSSAPLGRQVDSSVNLMTIGLTSIYWPDSKISVGNNTQNTERELVVSPACPDLYRPLAAELSRQLGQAAEPPAVIATSLQRQPALIETTSGSPVAMRLVLPTRSGAAEDRRSRTIAILLPEGSNLVAWFRAFLCDLHESDPFRVPQAPPAFEPTFGLVHSPRKGLGRSNFKNRI